MKNSLNIEYFPSSLLGKIFSHVDEEDLCNVIPQVCEKWKLVSASSSTLLKNANFKGAAISTKDICFTLHNATHLKSVAFISVKDVVPVVRQMCRCNKQVECVKIKNSSSEGNFVPESVLINILLSLTNLSRIQISQTKFKSHLFYEILATMTNITSVDFSLNEFITLSDLLIIVHNCNIREFKMSRRYRQPQISDEEMGYLIKSMKQNLVLLYLDMTGFGSSTFNEIFVCSKLTDLKLNNAMNLGDDLLEKLAKSLKKIRFLKMESPLVRQGGIFKALANSSKLAGQLMSLKIECCDCLNNYECSMILEACIKLKSLSLRECKLITIEGIGCSLTSIVNLEYLNITNIGSVYGITGIVSQLQQLLYLVIDESSFRFFNLSFVNSKFDVKLVEK